MKNKSSKNQIFEKEKISVISNLRKDSFIPRSFKNLPFLEIKDEVLGKNYEVSIVLVGESRIKSLNHNYRGKNYPTDVLSFSIEKNIGEVFICPKVAKTKSKKIDLPFLNSTSDNKKFEKYLFFLVIHAFLHLKGMEHGSKMEKYELAIYSRYRYRYV